MADAVTNLTIENTSRRLVTKHSSLSDGTGESAVVKVDKSTFTGPDGTEPSFFMIEKIEFDVGGMTVILLVDLTTDVVLFRLAGTGVIDLRDTGGLSTKQDGSSTGDIILTTNGHTSGDSYDITLHMRKHD